MTIIQIPCFTRNGRAGLRPRPLFLPESNSPDEGEVLVDTLSPASKKQMKENRPCRRDIPFCIVEKNLTEAFKKSAFLLNVQSSMTRVWQDFQYRGRITR